MGRTARDITAAFTAAKVSVEVRGNLDVSASAISPVEDIQPGSLIFVEKARDVAAALKSSASIVVLPQSEMSDLVPSSSRTILGVSDVRPTMPILLSLFDLRPVPAPGIHSTAVIHKSAVLGKDVAVGPHVTIGASCSIGDQVAIESGTSIGAGSAIGAGTRIFPGVRIYDGIRIGQRCRIHSGTVVGSDGYGYVSGPAGHQKVPQIGGVRIEDDVELGANVTIDRGTLGDTVIGRGTKIDNLVHLAHNVRIGAHCIVIAQTGIAGSARLGNGVVLAAQSGVAGHITIGDRTMIGARTGVTKSIPPGQAVSGFPARPHSEEKRVKVSMGKLPEMVKDVTRLKAAVLRLSRRISSIERAPVGAD